MSAANHALNKAAVEYAQTLVGAHRLQWNREDFDAGWDACAAFLLDAAWRHAADYPRSTAAGVARALANALGKRTDGA